MQSNAIVTGAGRHNGIGAQICRTLAQKNVNIYFTSFDKYDTNVGGIQKSEYEQTLKECRAFGVKAFYETFDLTERTNIITLFDNAIKKMGSVEILINCICCHEFDSFLEVNEMQINTNFNVNAKAVFFLCQEFYKRFSGASGRIINLSSTQNLEPLCNEIAYAISKATVPVIVSTLAPIMATKGITINAVNPGATEIGDISECNINLYQQSNYFNRLGTPEDAANLVCFLASNEGQWITGQTINSEGGIFRGITNILQS